VQTFPENEVKKGQLTMWLKKLRHEQDELAWPADNVDLPVVTWDSCASDSHPFPFRLLLPSFPIFSAPKLKFFNLPVYADKKAALRRPLIGIAGHIHDVSEFRDTHPGGHSILQRHVGKDATAAFFGGVYAHSNTAHNVCTPTNLSNSNI
jgi:stearoyl-CoA desaturase (delta-9 desaturase)